MYTWKIRNDLLVLTYDSKVSCCYFLGLGRYRHDFIFDNEKESTTHRNGNTTNRLGQFQTYGKL
jgi:hypothetical protein